VDAPSDAVRTCLDYFEFLHDRLVARVPEIAVVSLLRHQPDGDAAVEFTTTRVEADRTVFELHWHAPGTHADESAGRHCTVSRPANGTELRFAIPDDAPVAGLDDTTALYGLVVLAGLQADGGRPSRTAASAAYGIVRRSRRSGGHLERVAGYSRIIVRALMSPLGLTPAFADAVFRYAPLHDIGQVVFPEEIMQKPGRLDSTEWELMKSHTTRGRAIVDAVIENADPAVVPLPTVLRNIVELHHEALDGSGYPNGFAGDDVPIESRIVSVADVFDALISKRPYKPGWSVEQALTEMDRMVDSGKIDGRCLTALVTEPEIVEAVAAGGARPPRMMHP
jgi:HD-GYP domain-containing protein (c-di-GMP phosphodiesterase class II)